MKRSSQRGFTVVEVSIASAVFSVILLMALVIFFTIGRLFYKGISISTTQETATQIMQDINGNFQDAATVSPAQSGNGYNYYCIGNSRYTYNIGNQVDLDATVSHAAPGSGGNFGLLKDNLPGSAACAAPCNDIGAVVCGAGTIKLNNPTELLGQKMRLGQFSILPSSANSNLYNVNLMVIFGDDGTNGVIDYTSPGPPPDYSTAFCKSGPNTQFCSVNKVSTSVFRGLAF